MAKTKKTTKSLLELFPKSPTGIKGLDEITGGRRPPAKTIACRSPARSTASSAKNTARSPKAIRSREVEVAGLDGRITRVKEPYLIEDICNHCGICETVFCYI